jgi:hypothetical protein
MKFKYFYKILVQSISKRLPKVFLVEVVVTKILGWYPSQTSSDPFKRLSFKNLSPSDLRIKSKLYYFSNPMVFICKQTLFFLATICTNGKKTEKKEEKSIVDFFWGKITNFQIFFWKKSCHNSPLTLA